jgi:hypothetical protein
VQRRACNTTARALGSRAQPAAPPPPPAHNPQDQNTTILQSITMPAGDYEPHQLTSTQRVVYGPGFKVGLARGRTGSQPGALQRSAWQRRCKA